MICEVCGHQVAEGVFSSRIAPVSCAFCSSCLQQGAEAYGILVTHLSFLPNPQDWDQGLKRIVEVSLKVKNKTMVELKMDVEKMKFTAGQYENDCI